MEIGSHFELHKTNLLIIGGGPAGTSAGIWAAKFGLSVRIIESLKFPRNRPGETLHPGVETLFDQLGIREYIEAAKFLRHKGIWIRSNDRSDEDNNNNNESNRWNLITFGEDEKGPWHGYQIWRATLDSILLQQAQEYGAIILQPCQALDVILDADDKRVIGVKTSLGNFLADFVIDATGGTHWLARRLNLVIKKHSPPLFACYGYVKGKCPSLDEAPAMVVLPDGWIWTAKVQEHLYHWTRLYTNNKYMTIIHDGWLPDQFKRLKPVTSTYCADVTWRRAIQPAGQSYFIVGDAAFALDPASSHGVLKGIMSGMKAVHAIIRVIKDHFPSEIASKEYNERIAEWFFHDVRKLHKFYSLMDGVD